MDYFHWNLNLKFFRSLYPLYHSYSIYDEVQIIIIIQPIGAGFMIKKQLFLELYVQNTESSYFFEVRVCRALNV